MSQRQLLENSLKLAKTLKGPAKMLWAPATQGFPTLLHNILNPTNGAPAAGWNAFGLTRGGINVVKNMEIALRDDVDQILGAYDQDITGRAYTITTQLAEFLDRNQFAIAFELGLATQNLATTGEATQTRIQMDDGDNKTTERRLAVVFPKDVEGKAYAFVFRRAALTGGDKTVRFDRTDPVSPPLEFRAFPEIATFIDSAEAYGVIFDVE